ncbi:response regulator [Umezawaea endophytica]|uniref:Response regulator transcription factor n=1 Tax=Umezawaea endophytica TaxID=1654476 RepID=A0A9X2VUV1_9PSEU|nr:response regulator transcription factor [Umezawaea endophytica]MCS7482469.1 response regulator transcription factor [Umezawaea endophytica]
MRVVIAEDDALLREGLVLLMASKGEEVVAAVDNATDFLAVIARDRPDVVVMDVRLPPSFRDEGIRAAAEARRIHPGLPVLVLSSYVEDSYASELLADGVGGIGYLLKERVGRVESFLDSVRRVADGATVMDPEVISQLMLLRTKGSPLDTLTPRERDVLALMAEGLSNSSISSRLTVTDGAVHKHIRNIFTKLHLPHDDDSGDRRVLAVLAFLRG